MKKIYILHGWAYSTERWKPFVEELEKSGFEIELLKIPGLTAPLDDVWNIDNYVDWLSEVLTKEKEPVILLGHSNGGLIALAYSLKYPEKVGKIILIDSTGIYHKEVALRIKRVVFMIAAKIGRRIVNSQIARRFIYKLANAHDYENANPVMKKTMLNLINTDLREKFASIAIPTIIIWGRKDQMTPLGDGKFMNNSIKNSRLYIIDAARHSPQLTHPKETARIIIENI